MIPLLERRSGAERAQGASESASPGQGQAFASCAQIQKSANVGFLIAYATLGLYKIFISPLIVILLGPACRFEPSCSTYANEAIARYGLMYGGCRAFRRLMRCRPGGGWGYDPVVKRRPSAASDPMIVEWGERCGE